MIEGSFIHQAVAPGTLGGFVSLVQPWLHARAVARFHAAVISSGEKSFRGFLSRSNSSRTFSKHGLAASRSLALAAFSSAKASCLRPSHWRLAESAP